MVQIDVPIVFGLGCLFADAARDHLRRERETSRDEAFYRGLAANLVFLALFVSWLPVYLLVTHFGFETSHMWWHEDSVTDYPLFLPVFLVVLFGANLLGYWSGARLVQGGRVGWNRLLIAVTVVFSLVWVFGQSHRTLVLGTYREWAAGTAPPLSSDPFVLKLLAASAAIFTVGVVAFYWWVRRAERG